MVLWALWVPALASRDTSQTAAVQDKGQSYRVSQSGYYKIRLTTGNATADSLAGSKYQAPLHETW